MRPRKETEELLRKTLRELKASLGESLLKMLLERILEDLALSNPRLREVKVPEEVLSWDLSAFGDRELENLYYLLTELGGSLIGWDFKYRKLSEWCSQLGA